MSSSCTCSASRRAPCCRLRERIGRVLKTRRRPNQNIWMCWSVRVSRRRYRFCASTSAPSSGRPHPGRRSLIQVVPWPRQSWQKRFLAKPGGPYFGPYAPVRLGPLGNGHQQGINVLHRLKRLPTAQNALEVLAGAISWGFKSPSPHQILEGLRVLVWTLFS
jgi:hypothetical protein